jgi:hypothetical protein
MVECMIGDDAGIRVMGWSKERRKRNNNKRVDAQKGEKYRRRTQHNKPNLVSR